MFSYVSPEQRVPWDHPLRALRKLTDAVLGSLSVEFDQLYPASERPSIAPEYILLSVRTRGNLALTPCSTSGFHNVDFCLWPSIPSLQMSS